MNKTNEEKDQPGEKEKAPAEEKELVAHSSLDILCGEPKIEQQPETTSMEDISMRRIAEDESKRRAMVEEDSSRRGSLLDELREEEEMRLRLLQVGKLEIEVTRP